MPRLIVLAVLIPLLAACANKGAAPLPSGPVRALNSGKWTPAADLRIVGVAP